MAAVPKQKAGIASVVNGGRTPRPVITAAKGSVGGAAAAAQQLNQAGHTRMAHTLHDESVAAFLHSLTGASLDAAGVAAIGIVLVGIWLPTRPRPLIGQAGYARKGDRLTVHGDIGGGWQHA